MCLPKHEKFLIILRESQRIVFDVAKDQIILGFFTSICSLPKPLRNNCGESSQFIFMPPLIELLNGLFKVFTGYFDCERIKILQLLNNSSILILGCGTNIQSIIFLNLSRNKLLILLPLVHLKEPDECALLIHDPPQFIEYFFILSIFMHQLCFFLFSGDDPCVEGAACHIDGLVLIDSVLVIALFNHFAYLAPGRHLFLFIAGSLVLQTHESRLLQDLVRWLVPNLMLL